MLLEEGESAEEENLLQKRSPIVIDDSSHCELLLY